MSSGLGHHFVSPKKPRDKNKTQKIIELPGVAAKRRRLLTQMEQLMNPESKKNTNSVHIEEVTEIISNSDDFDVNMAEIPVPDLDIPAESPSTTPLEESRKRRVVPDKSMEMLYDSWKALIPSLIDPYLKYSARTLATALTISPNTISACATPSCDFKQTSIVCLFFDSKCCCLLVCIIVNAAQDLCPSMSSVVDVLRFLRYFSTTACFQLLPHSPVWLYLLNFYPSIALFSSALAMPSMP